MFERPNAQQVHISLAEIEPAIWRRLIVPADWTLDQLHLGIQAAFGWANSHLHEFLIGGLRYGDVATLSDGAFDDDARVFDSTEVRLRDFQGDCVEFLYLYDFGDSWRHVVRLEKPVLLEVVPKFAFCSAGARARPPEDVGGISGYRRFLEILADPDDDEYADTNRWCGGHFDPEWFDLDLINKDLRNALRLNARRPLVQPKPKQPKS